jgi:hypothetical protein
MTLLKCTIHNLTFGAEEMPTHEIACPKCSHIERTKLRAQVRELTEHRDALLRAFEIKQTVSPQPGPSHTLDPLK